MGDQRMTQGTWDSGIRGRCTTGGTRTVEDVGRPEVKWAMQGMPEVNWAMQRMLEVNWTMRGCRRSSGRPREAKGNDGMSD